MSKFYKSQKQAFFIGIIICFILIAVFVVRFTSSPEDYWQCQNGVWIKHGNPEASYPVTVCPPSNSKSFTAQNVVENFYNWHFHSDGGVMQNNFYKNSDYLSQNLKNDISSKLSKDNGHNPFVCNNRTDMPISFSAQEVYNKNNKALVMIFQNFDTNQDRLEVTLYKKDDVWLINNINCAATLESIKDVTVTGDIVEAN